MADTYHQYNRQGQWGYGGNSNNDYYNQGQPPDQGYPPTSGYRNDPPQYNHANPTSMEYRGGQGPDQDQDRGLLEHVPFTAQHAQHEAKKHRHPLAYLLNKEGTKIVLELIDTGNENGDKLIPKSQDEDSFKHAYTVRYNGDDFSGRVWGAPAPDFNEDDEVEVGTWDVFENRKDKIKFVFPWLTWSLDPQNDHWTSDAKLLGGEAEMRWIFTDESNGQGQDDRSHVDFTLRCVDVSDSERRLVSKMVLREYTKMTIEIPVKIIGDKKQLDELIVVSVAMMDWYRDQILNGTLEN